MSGQKQISLLLDKEGQPSEGLGYHFGISADGTVLAVSSVVNDNVSYTGFVKIYKNSNGSLTQLGDTIFPYLSTYGDGNAPQFAQFGWKLSLSSTGNIIAISQVNNSSSSDGLGLVRMYKRDEDNQSIEPHGWTQLGNDIVGSTSPGPGGDHLGEAICLSSDGYTVAIGAPKAAGLDGGQWSGKASVFQYDNSTNNWSQVGNDFNGENAYEYYGISIGLSGDGSILAIGGNGYGKDNGAHGTGKGRIRVYKRDANNQSVAPFGWTKIGADFVGDNFGDAVGTTLSLSSNGNRLAVSAHGFDGAGQNRGKITVYEYDIIADNWVQLGSDISGLYDDERLGYSLGPQSFNSDGTILAIGSKNHPNAATANAGRVQVFEFVNSQWSTIEADPTIVNGPDTHAIYGTFSYENFGHNIKLSGDGLTLVTGAHSFDGGTGSHQDNRGILRLFSISGSASSAADPYNAIVSMAYSSSSNPFTAIEAKIAAINNTNAGETQINEVFSDTFDNADNFHISNTDDTPTRNTKINNRHILFRQTARRLAERVRVSGVTESYYLMSGLEFKRMMTDDNDTNTNRKNAYSNLESKSVRVFNVTPSQVRTLDLNNEAYYIPLQNGEEITIKLSSTDTKQYKITKSSSEIYSIEENDGGVFSTLDLASNNTNGSVFDFPNTNIQFIWGSVTINNSSSSSSSASSSASASASSSSSSSASSVGDPYITTIDGVQYKLPNITGYIRLYDNMNTDNRVVINGELWQLPREIYDKAVEELGADIDFNATYFRKIYIHQEGKQPIVYDLERMSLLSGKVSQQLTTDSYMNLDVYKNETYNAVKLMIANITVELQRFMNPQIRTGISISGHELEKGFGALVRKYPIRSLMMKKLDYTKQIQSTPSTVVENKGSVTESFNGKSVKFVTF